MLLLLALIGSVSVEKEIAVQTTSDRVSLSLPLSSLFANELCQCLMWSKAAMETFPTSVSKGLSTGAISTEMLTQGLGDTKKFTKLYLVIRTTLFVFQEDKEF